MTVKRENLLIIAVALWLIAGINVIAIGIRGLISIGTAGIGWAALALAGAMIIFMAFHAMFSKMVRRYTSRIFAMPEPRQNPLRFFDARGYVIMAIMMAGGFGLRAAGLIPDWFVAFFYVGLGFALTLAGVGFAMHRIKGEDWTFHKARCAKKANPEMN
ncbi:MAG: hypothetical protein IJG53_01630 [Eggerthellaceae bacterium]|nr:hypothetical protein [Eggerthellaceae bacterium]